MMEAAKTTTSEALLGLLSLRPMSGYEIRQMIESSIGNFWSESFGQIYPTLKRLEKGGWVAAEKAAKAEAKTGRASRRYRLTPLGCERLHAWLGVRAKPQVPRNELLLKLFFGANAPVSAMKAHIVGTKATYAADLQRYEEMSAEMARTHRQLPGYPFWMITLRYGMAEAEAMIAWAEESLAALEDVERGRAGKRSKRRLQHAS